MPRLTTCSYIVWSRWWPVSAPAYVVRGNESPPNGRWETRPSSSREKGIPQCSRFIVSSGEFWVRVSTAGASAR
jgi:hypothetical protein